MQHIVCFSKQQQKLKHECNEDKVGDITLL